MTKAPRRAPHDPSLIGRLKNCPVAQHLTRHAAARLEWLEYVVCRLEAQHRLDAVAIEMHGFSQKALKARVAELEAKTSGLKAEELAAVDRMLQRLKAGDISKAQLQQMIAERKAQRLKAGDIPEAQVQQMIAERKAAD